MRAVGIVGWLVIVGAFLAWQGVGLVRSDWPTMSDIFRAAMRPAGARFLLFGIFAQVVWWSPPHERTTNELPLPDVSSRPTNGSRRPPAGR